MYNSICELNSLNCYYFLQVPLGVQLLNENKTNEMCHIMKALHKYVPTKSIEKTYHLHDKDMVCEEGHHHKILFGGDQLTVRRSRGAQAARSNDDRTLHASRLDGLVPVAEDWHARMTLLRVSSHCSFKYHIILIFMVKKFCCITSFPSFLPKCWRLPVFIVFMYKS